jgi:hypothetical protein
MLEDIEHHISDDGYGRHHRTPARTLVSIVVVE